MINGSVTKVERIIYVIRGHKVMMDSDLVELYEIDLRDLTRQVKRNISRFPDDFMFFPDSKELEELRFQFGTANPPSNWNHMRRSTPMLFTESGVSMLSSVLNSERAIQINITIIRVFTQMRSYLAIENANTDRISKLEKNTNNLFKVVLERMDGIEEVIDTKLPKRKKKIGLKED